MDCKIYNPTVTTTTLIDGYNNVNNLTHSADQTIAYYQGKYFAVCDNSTGYGDGAPGQKAWMLTSTDGVTWTTPFTPFRDAAYSNNPVTTAGWAIDWQPNLVVVGTELWCTWISSEYAFISKLTSPSGKWTNYRFEFVGEKPYFSPTLTGSVTPGRTAWPAFDGITDWMPFFTGSPTVLSNGTVSCPLILQSQSTMSTHTDSPYDFIRSVKYPVLFNTKNGTDWTAVRIITAQSILKDFASWEPFISEDNAGTVYCYIRNMDAAALDEDFLVVAISYDGGETFSSPVSSKMLVPSTRGYIEKTSDSRWTMAHVDYPAGSTGDSQASPSGNRVNGALFFSRRGVPDFIPAVNFSAGSESNVISYPNFTLSPDKTKALIIYSAESGSTTYTKRRLMLATVNPLPTDDYAWVHPRSNTELAPPPPTLYDPVINSSATPPYYDFSGYSKLAGTTPCTGTTGVSFAAWVNPNDHTAQTVIDARDSVLNTGPVMCLGFAAAPFNFTHNLTYTIPAWNAKNIFMALVVDNPTRTVTQYIGDTTGLQSVVSYFRCLTFSGNPVDGDTVTINSVTYTFRTSASLANEVAIGGAVATTIYNLGVKLTANSVTIRALPGNQLFMSRNDWADFGATSGSSSITVGTQDLSYAGPANVGYKYTGLSGLVGWKGRIYDARFYNSTLSLANIKSLFNAKATVFGYSSLPGATAPGAPTVFADPGSHNLTEFPSIGAAPARSRCEVVDANTLRLYGEGSASVELPYAVSSVTLRWKLGAVPTGGDKYVIATFGTVNKPVRLYMQGGSSGLFLNGTQVATIDDPTIYNTTTVTVSSKAVRVLDRDKSFAGKPRMFLGNAYPEGALSSSKTTVFDVSSMSVDRKVS